MGITVNTSPQQITASVGETKIDVSVSGGIGPSGLDGGGYTLPTATASVLGGVKIGSGVTITDGVISVSTDYAAASHASTHAPGGADELFDQSLNTDDSPTFAGLTIVTGEGTVFLTEETGVVFGNTATFNGYTDFSSATIAGLSYNSLDDLPSLFDGAYTSLTSVPSTFTPSAHKTSHATGGSDALTASDIGAAAASHTHGSITNAGSIGSTSGLVVTTGASGVLGALAQGTAGQVLKVNSGATGVEWGAAAADVSIDTTAADVLSASSGSITADDPGADRIVFWDDSASKLTHLEVGTGLSISGTTLSSTASGTKSFAKFTASDNNPPASNFATLDTRNSVLVLEFDASTDESAVFVGYIPEGATLTNGLKVRISWMADTATSGNVRWGVQFEADGTDLDSDSFDTAALATSAANGTSGIETVAEITATSIDSLAAGDRFRLKIYRDADDATNDTMTGDAQLVAVEVQAA